MLLPFYENGLHSKMGALAPPMVDAHSIFENILDDCIPQFMANPASQRHRRLVR
jgi:hypothetical protein